VLLSSVLRSLTTASPHVSQAITELRGFKRARCDFTGPIGALCETDEDCFSGFCRVSGVPGARTVVHRYSTRDCARVRLTWGLRWQAGLPRCRFRFLAECEKDSDCTPFDEFDFCLFRKDMYTVARMALTWFWKIGRPAIDVENSVRWCLVLAAPERC
jgi:hypothetical protein